MCIIHTVHVHVCSSLNDCHVETSSNCSQRALYLESRPYSFCLCTYNYSLWFTSAQCSTYSAVYVFMHVRRVIHVNMYMLTCIFNYRHRSDNYKSPCYKIEGEWNSILYAKKPNGVSIII